MKVDDGASESVLASFLNSIMSANAHVLDLRLILKPGARYLRDREPLSFEAYRISIPVSLAKETSMVIAMRANVEIFGSTRPLSILLSAPRDNPVYSNVANAGRPWSVRRIMDKKKNIGITVIRRLARSVVVP